MFKVTGSVLSMFAFAALACAGEFEVPLSVKEPAGVARPAWPVTSGVPLPEGAVKKAGELVLLDAAGKPVPCQTEAVCRWPDGSLKWVHLSFQADLPGNGERKYKLAKGKPAEIAKPLKVTETGDSIVIDTGAARITISKKTGSIIESLEVGGKKVLLGQGMSLVGGTYVSRITKARYKHSKDKWWLKLGKLRITPKCGTEKWTLRPVDAEHAELVGSKTGPDGRFSNKIKAPWLSKSGKVVISPEYVWGKLGFGELSEKTFWTFETDGGGNGKVFSTILGKIEKVEVEKSGPLVACVYLQGTFATRDGRPVVPVGKDAKGRPYQDPSGDFLKHRTRIYAYAGKPYLYIVPAITHVGPFDGSCFASFQSLSMNFSAPGVTGGDAVKLSGKDGKVGKTARLLQLLGVTPMTERGLKRKLSYGVAFNGKGTPRGQKAVGSCLIGKGDATLGLGIRRFWEYGPKGIAVSPGRAKLELWPAVEEIDCYRLGQGRQRSHEILITASALAEQELAAFQAPRLIAVAPGSWYANCGVFGMTAEERDYGKEGYPKPQLEALERYERMMKCLVDNKFSTRGAKGSSAPATFVPGWCDYGDLPWADGWSNLHYDWTMTMLLHFLRTGKREFFDTADAMAWHRKDIAQNHSAQCGRTDRYTTLTNRISFYEKDNHRTARGGMWTGRPTHTWNRGIGYWYLLTGDPMARLVAVESAEGLRHLNRGMGALISGKGKKASNANAELRKYGWSIENFLGAYEVTGEKKYLDWALGLFNATFGAIHEGRTVEEAKKMPVLMYGYSFSPICRLHHYTGDKKVLEGLRYLVEEALLKRFVKIGKETGGGKYLVSAPPYRWLKKNGEQQTGQQIVWNFFWGNPMAYLYMQTGEKKYLDLSRQFFRESIFYYDAPYKPIDPKYRSPLSYYVSKFGKTSTKIHGWSGRFNHIYLYMEKELAKGAKFPVK